MKKLIKYSLVSVLIFPSLGYAEGKLEDCNQAAYDANSSCENAAQNNIDYICGHVPEDEMEACYEDEQYRKDACQNDLNMALDECACAFAEPEPEGEVQLADNEDSDDEETAEADGEYAE